MNRTRVLVNRKSFLLGALALAAAGCGSSADSGPPASGGATGGTASGGANAASGGQSGALATGGRVGTGGASGGTAAIVAAGGAGGPAPVLPPAGKTWLLIGQDVSTIETYATAVAVPGGLVGYTSLQTLGGLDQAEDNGSGVNFMQSLVARYPSVPVAIGLYLVGELDAVNAGSLDGSLDALTAKLAALSRPVLLRIGYEFDNPSNRYDPTAFRAAFARIAARVRRGLGNQVATVWQSAAICGQPIGTLQSYYPGDAAVDWVGLSYFRQASCNYAPVQSVVAFARGQGKPVLIAESAPQGYNLSSGTYSNDGATFASKTGAQAWQEWFAPLLSFVWQNADVIRGVSYIDADWNAQPMWSPPYANGYFGDSRVQADATVLANWRTALADTRWATP